MTGWSLKGGVLLVLFYSLIGFYERIAPSDAVLCCCGLALVSTFLTPVAPGQSYVPKAAHLQVVVVKTV